MTAAAPLRSASVRLLLLIQLICCSRLAAAEFGVSASGHYLTLGNKPFFWLGDTVWLLAQVPTRDELELYLRARAAQGFTVIQLTAVMGEERVWGTARPTSRSDTPFIDHDVLKPAVTPGNNAADATQYDYWDHLDYVLERIHAHGLRAALVAYFVGWRGDGYKFLQPTNAYQYGRFLGQRYRGKPELIWVLGGDNTPDTDARKAVWNRLARGLAEGLSGREDYSQVLCTYHINGGASSSQIWHEAPWLDFNMAQTWSDYQNIYPVLLRDYARTPTKPCGLGAGAYEDGPQYPTKPINALVIREQACWSWFAGGYHTYGNGNVWHFNTFKAESTQPWTEALRSPGAETLRHIRRALESIEWWRLVPDETLFTEGKGSGKSLNVAMRSSAGDALAAYLCSPAPVKLRLEPMTGQSKLVAKWVNPATGEEHSAGAFSNQSRSFSVPPGWEDALLIIVAQRTPRSDRLR